MSEDRTPEELALLAENDHNDDRGELQQLGVDTQQQLQEAMRARALLAQLKSPPPPERLPINTARRARKRLRSQVDPIDRSRLESWIIPLMILLLISTVSFLTYHYSELRNREIIRNLTP